MTLPNILVAQQPVPGTNFILPLHFFIGDKDGKVLVVEYIKGKRYVYDNPIGVLTNAPSFEWHLENLSNYVNLTPVNAAAKSINGFMIASIGQGSGLLGIPGDYTPPSRFIRAAIYSTSALAPNTSSDTARLGFHILNTFDIFFGIVRNPNATSGTRQAGNTKLQNSLAHDTEFTQWTVVHDRTNLKTYFRSYDSMQVQLVDLTKVDFMQPGFKQIDMQQNFIVDDVTDKTRALPDPKNTL